MARWTFVLPIQIRSLNVIRRKYRNRHAYRRLRDDYGWMVRAMTRKIPKAKGPRRVEITRLIGPSGRLFDFDNLVGGFKPLLDEIVKAGLLVDDDPENAEVSYAQERGPEHAVRVELEDR